MLAATSALPFTVFVFELLYVITLCHFLTFFVFVFLFYANNFSQLVCRFVFSTWPGLYAVLACFLFPFVRSDWGVLA